MKTSLSHLPQIKQEQILQIVDIIKEVAAPEKIILFGSYAKGNFVEHRYTGRDGILYEYISDYDFLVVTKTNCGPASVYADENIEGFLKVSKSLLGKQQGIFAIKAQGLSLNRANIKGKNIEPGDFVIVDSTQTSPKDGDYVPEPFVV